MSAPQPHVGADARYANYELSQGWNEKDFGSFNGRQADYYKAELFACGLKEKQNLRALDIGFGNGAFLGWCRSQSWQCEGIELNDRLISRGLSLGYNVANDLTSLCPAGQTVCYDLLTAFDVLEHIDKDSLVPFLRSFLKVCSETTLLVLRFPNGDNPFSMPVQHGDVTHKTAIGQAMLRQVAALANYEIVSIRSPIQVMTGQSVMRRLSIVLGMPIRWLIGGTIRHLFMGSAPVSFSTNLIAVLKRSASSQS